MYLPHHILALTLGLAIRSGMFVKWTAAEYMLVIEASNAFFGVWDLCRKNRKDSPYCQNWYRVLSALVFATYIPLRTIGLGWATYNMFVDMDPSLGLPFQGVLTISLGLIYAMSVYFSMTMTRMMIYIFFTKQLVVHFEE